MDSNERSPQGRNYEYVNGYKPDDGKRPPQKKKKKKKKRIKMLKRDFRLLIAFVVAISLIVGGTAGYVIGTKKSKSSSEDIGKTTTAETTTQTTQEKITVTPPEGTTSDYYLVVYRSDNVVVAYKKDTAGKYSTIAKTMLCSVGLATTTDNTTPAGDYTTGEAYEWHSLNGGVYGHYCTRIGSYSLHILFHSVPYIRNEDPSSLEGADASVAGYEQYNKLGSNASEGCVRLSVNNSKWIYQNCSAGTAVTITADKLPSFVKRPTQVKIDSSVSADKQWWDPTDDDKNNPYNK